MSKNETRFWHTNAFDGLKAGGGEGKSAIACEPDVFGSKNDHSSGDKLGVFAGFDHAGEVVESGISVGAAEGFNKGRNSIVVQVAFFIVMRDFLAGCLEDDFDVYFVGERKGEF